MRQGQRNMETSILSGSPICMVANGRRLAKLTWGDSVHHRVVTFYPDGSLPPAARSSSHMLSQDDLEDLASGSSRDTLTPRLR